MLRILAVCVCVFSLTGCSFHTGFGLGLGNRSAFSTGVGFHIGSGPNHPGGETVPLAPEVELGEPQVIE